MEDEANMKFLRHQQFVDAEILKKTKLVLAAMKTLEAKGHLNAEAVADLNEMANSPVTEVRVLVRREFGKYLKP